jgi:hypothetical protein
MFGARTVGQNWLRFRKTMHLSLKTRPQIGPHDHDTVRAHRLRTSPLASSRLDPISSLQQTFGNQALQRFLRASVSRPVEPASEARTKLIAASPGDSERQAFAPRAQRLQQGSGSQSTPGAGVPDLQPQPMAGTMVGPSFVSGSVSITEAPLSVVQTGGEILDAAMEFTISKPFTVTASGAEVKEPNAAEPFEYGLVQNLWFDHVEEVFTSGDILVDSVGPEVDIDPKNPSEMPFMHGNATVGSTLGAKMFAVPQFTDVPSIEVGLHETHCKMSVDLVSVTRSTAFKVGLVARGMKTQTLFPLAEIPGTYASEWRVGFNGNAWKSSETTTPKGTYTLSAPTKALVNSGTIAGVEGQKALNAETAAFRTRCVNVLASNESGGAKGEPERSPA